MPLDIEVGPDGAIYVVNYQGWFNSTPETSIDRLEYIGPACAAQSSLIVEKAGCQDSRYVEFDATATHPWPEACITLSTSNRQLVALRCGRTHLRWVQRWAHPNSQRRNAGSVAGSIRVTTS